MKTLHAATKALCVLTLACFSGCHSVPGPGGGGNAPGAPDPVQDPAQDPDPGNVGLNPGVADLVAHVSGKGLVTHVRPNGQREPLRGAEVAVVADGRTISVATTDDRGVYRVQLKRGRQNSLTARKAAYSFDPSPLFVTPNRPVVLNEIEGRMMRLPGPGSAGQVDDPVIPGQSAPGDFQGTVTIRLRMDPAAAAIHRERGTTINILDSQSNRIAFLAIDRNATTGTYVHCRVGEVYIFEPSTLNTGGLVAQPARRSIRISRNPQSLTFDMVARAASPRPTPRPVVSPQPASNPTFYPKPLPASRATPTPFPTFRRPVTSQSNP